MAAPLRYRDPVEPSDYTRYAPWVRALMGRSGAYVIRDAKTARVLYVGESHTGRLYATLTRHFQDWQGYTAGTTYDRLGVEVAVTSLDEPAARVVARQVELIGLLGPLDNTHHVLPFEAEEEIDSADFMDEW